MNYSPSELTGLGLRYGANVSIHRTVEFFGPDRIKIGSNVRVDCHCVISASEPVTIGDHVHLGAGVHLFGSAGIELGNFVGLSSRVSIFSVSDDYTDGFLTNPTIPDQFKNIQAGKVTLHPHVVVGCGSVIMPGVTMERGVAVGALSFVNKSIPEFLIVAGYPARRIGVRNGVRLANLEREFIATVSTSS